MTIMHTKYCRYTLTDENSNSRCTEKQRSGVKNFLNSRLLAVTTNERPSVDFVHTPTVVLLSNMDDLRPRVVIV